MKKIVILCDIRSEENVGSIFRVSDCAGISEIFLGGYTPEPIDKFGRINKKISKVALGAEKTISWKKSKSVLSLVRKLKKQGVFIIGLEQARDSIDYKKVSLKNKKEVAFIFGNEVNGIPKNILKECDVIAEIKMLGKKESLNVAISAGISLFRILGI